DITARKQADQRHIVQYAVAQALADSAQLESAAPRILQAVCEGLRWDFGAIWGFVREGGGLRCVDSWDRSGVKVRAFEDCTRESTFARGGGFPGRIWESGAPGWISNVVNEQQFPRAPVAAKCGLHAAFGFPISLGEEVLGVIEFFSRE